MSAILALGPARQAAAQTAPLVVRELSFHGNHAIDAYTLSSGIRTTNSSAFARSPLLRWIGLGDKRSFNETDFRGDVLRIAVMYRRAGYRRVTVDTSVRRTAKDVYISITIHEGEPLHLVKLDIGGLDSVEQRSRVVQDLPIARGDVYSLDRLLDAADTIAVRLRNLGYPTATVDTTASVNLDARTAVAALLVTTGPTAVFGKTRVTGTTQVDTAFIANLVPARPGNQYRLDEIFRSQRALYKADLFRFASVGIDTALFHQGDRTVPLIVNVLDSKSHRARASAGFGTDDCLRTSAGWTARNFAGDGFVLDVTGQLSKIGVGAPLGFGAEKTFCSRLADDSIASRDANYAVNVSLRRNAFLSADNTLVFSLFGERHGEFEVYLRREIGFSVSLTRESSSRIPVTLSYRLAYGSTHANPASFCAFLNTCIAADIAQLSKSRLQGILTLAVQRQRVNNLLDPTRGTLMSLSAATSSQLLGSGTTQQFTRFVGDIAGFLPLTRSVVLAAHLRAGIIFSPKIDLSTESTNFIPPDQRFYAGGPNDVRGYDQNELGPVVYIVPSDSVTAGATPPFPSSATRVAATGGNRVAIGNVELRLPSPIFAQRLRFATFVDAGTLSGESGTAPVRVTPGFGLRVASPLGPIRFDMAYNQYPLQGGAVYSISRSGTLDLIQEGFVKDRGRKWTLHFSIGQAF